MIKGIHCTGSYCSFCSFQLNSIFLFHFLCCRFFDFPDLTKIHGREPDSESLYKIPNELRANAKSVYSNLSDGAHGHLALVMPAAQYALFSNMQFVRPAHPGTLLIPAQTTAAQSQVLHEHHKEQLRLFREVEGVEKALIQQIIKSVEAPYKQLPHRDSATNSGLLRADCICWPSASRHKC